MNLYLFILENKLVFEILYSLIIAFICGMIVVKADKIFGLSSYQGIRYFRNAFLFFGVAFIARYVFGVFSDLSLDYSYLIQIVFEYFLIMAGFFLLYSLIWKRIDSKKTIHKSSLFNSKITIFHLIAIIFAVIDCFWRSYFLMFASQILLFLYASIISFLNYKKKGKRHKFLKFYFIAMLLSLIAWTLNLLAASIFQWNPIVLIQIGIINITFFLLFLLGVIKFTSK